MLPHPERGPCSSPVHHYHDPDLEFDIPSSPKSTPTRYNPEVSDPTQHLLGELDILCEKQIPPRTTQLTPADIRGLRVPRQIPAVTPIKPMVYHPFGSCDGPDLTVQALREFIAKRPPSDKG
jgi:hypothetical protein